MNATSYGPLGLALLLAYFGSLGLLSLYGAHRWFMVWLWARHRRARPVPHARFDVLPNLTVQLPIYNELYVVRRLIDAVCALDYPADRLEIQVLDDSTDETSAVVTDAVASWRRRGRDIVVLRRPTRDGFKAGALQEGLARARGELIAVFDADFVPAPDFARRLVDHFTDPAVGMVQARWGHLNANDSALTRVQASLLDGHFVIEHTARHRSGRMFNFNGTAGIWRRRCIEESGGWHHDTLTEDLDLSYRAQLAGWRFVYELDHRVPAELPVEMSAFKAQQHRWAKGSIQTARKLLPALLASRLPARVKLEALAHLTANVGYLLLFCLSLLVVPAVWLRAGVSPVWVAAVDLPLFTVSTLSVVGFYLVAHRGAGVTWGARLVRIPFLMAVGVGLSVNNARAVAEALLGRDSEFRRTPKYNLGRGESPAHRRYRIARGLDTWVELALAIWFTAAAVAALGAGLWAALPFLVLFQVGFAYTAWSTLREARATTPG